MAQPRTLKAELLGIVLFNRSKTDQDLPQGKRHRIHGNWISRRIGIVLVVRPWEQTKRVQKPAALNVYPTNEGAGA
jgi:hypothetical protein